MRTVVEDARAQMVDANLPFKLWAKLMNTMVYIKNRSPTSAVYEKTITLIQDFHPDERSNVNHICIVGSEAYMFHESVTRPGMTSKTLTRYLVGYGGRNQYQIYNSTRHSMFLRRDIEFNEQVVGPFKPAITINNSFENSTDVRMNNLIDGKNGWIIKSGNSPVYSASTKARHRRCMCLQVACTRSMKSNTLSNCENNN